MVSVVAARDQFREPDEKAPDQAILVVPGGVAGSTTVANLMSRRLDRLSRYLEGEVSRLEKEEKRRGRGNVNAAAGGGGGGGGLSLLGSLGAGAAGAGIAAMGKKLFRVLSAGAALKGLGRVGTTRLLGPLGAAIGAYDFAKDVGNKRDTSILGAALTGATAGGTLGTFFGGVGMVPGAIIGAAAGAGIAVVYNARTQIAEFASNAYGWVTQSASSAFGTISRVVDGILSSGKAFGTKIYDTVASGWNYIAEQFSELRDSTSSWFTTQSERLKEWLSSVAASIQAGLAVLANPVDFAKRWLAQIGQLLQGVLPKRAEGDTGLTTTKFGEKYAARRSGGGGSGAAPSGTARKPEPQFGGDYTTGGGFDPATGRSKFQPTPPSYGRSMPPRVSQGESSRQAPGESQASSVPAYNQFRPVQGGGGSAVRDSRGRVVSTADTSMPSHQRAFLDTIAMGNATSGGNYWESPDYNTIVGGRKFTDTSDHPRMFGVPGSTAAGRYQFTKSTWDRVVKKYNAENPDKPIRGFSPEEQDRAAWWLAKDDYRRRSGGRDLDEDLRNKDPRVGHFIKSHLGGEGKNTTWEILQRKSPEAIREAYEANLERNKQYEKEAEAERNKKVEVVRSQVQEGRAVDSSMFDPNVTRAPNLASGQPVSSARGGGRVLEPNVGAEGTIRNKEISAKLRDQLSYAAHHSGVEVVVTSGGQDGRGEGTRRTGSTRHDHGNAADFDLYVTENGKRRKLSASNPADRAIMEKFVEAGSRAGMTGWGHGRGYMGDSKIHGGGGTEATWGRSGRGGWLSHAVGRGREQRETFDLAAWKKQQDASVSARVKIQTSQEKIAEAGARGEAQGSADRRGFFDYAPNLRESTVGYAGPQGGRQVIPDDVGPDFGTSPVTASSPQVEPTPPPAVPESVQPEPAPTAPAEGEAGATGTQSAGHSRASLDQIPIFNPDVNLSVMAMSDEA